MTYADAFKQTLEIDPHTAATSELQRSFANSRVGKALVMIDMLCLIFYFLRPL